jgi:hypothetical protein
MRAREAEILNGIEVDWVISVVKAWIEVAYFVSVQPDKKLTKTSSFTYGI